VTAQRFEPNPESAGRARRFVESQLGDVHDPDVLHRTLLAVSEMATNAIVHARSPFLVEVDSNGHVRVAVADRSADLPVPRAPDSLDTSGRGLLLLEALCSRWGAERRPPGKLVWCEIDLDGDDHA
jgi:anti-sigma regulatory factor (Ser/Thr protein kinase)